MDPFGLRRVVSPPGVLPQQARVLDPTLPLGPDELAIDVESLNVDSASFRQLATEAGDDPGRIAAQVQRIVRERGKLQNPVTGSGGMLIGRVAEIGPDHPAAATLRVGDRIATLVSLTLTPLTLAVIRKVHLASERIDCDGRAILFATGAWARVPADLPEAVTLAALDVCGAPALVARHLRPGQRVLVIGAGKAGALVGAIARRQLGPGAEVVAIDRSAEALAAMSAAGACTRTAVADATDAVATKAALDASGGSFDLVVSCASVPGTEMTALLAVRDGGTVVFFSMATSFTAAALGAEGIARDATLVIGTGFVPGHADLTLDLLRTDPKLRALFERRTASKEP